MNLRPDPLLPDLQLARAIHEMKTHLIRLEGRFASHEIRTDLRTWLILCSIPVSAVLMLLVLAGILRA